MHKKIISLLLLAILLSLPPTFCAAAAETVQDNLKVTVNGNAVHISGASAAPEEFVIVQLLRGSQKAETAAAVEENAVHFGMCEADKEGAFSYDFTVSALTGEEYLYVKCDSFEHFALLEDKKPTHTIYVSPGGSDSAAGTKEAPLKTLNGARAAAAMLDKTKVKADVVFAGGEYFLEGTTTFAASDSGLANSPVTYKAAEGEKPVFTTSKRLDASGFAPVTDSAVLVRLPEEAKGKVLQLDLTENGVTKADVELLSRTSNLLNERGLLLNGKPQRIARYPNTGFLRIGSGNVVSAGSSGAGGVTNCVFKWNDERISRWDTAESFWIEGYFSEEYRADTASDCAVDAAAKQITMKKSEKGIAASTRWRAINLLEELDIPGEWYIDKESLTLYYYPPHYFDAASDELRFTVNANSKGLGVSVFMNGVSNLRFEGLEFRDKYYGSFFRGGIGGAKVDGISFVNCSFANTATAIEMDGTNLTVDNCDFRNLQGQAVRLSDQGAINTLTPSNITVTNNYIYNADIGSAPIMVGGVGARIANNLIHRTDDGGIVLGSIDPQWRNAESVTEYNETYNGLREKGDMSMIYMGRSWYSPGTQINRNYIHDFGVHENAGWFSNPTYGIFADDTQSNASFESNIINANNTAKTYGIVIGGGSNIDVVGNTILNCTQGANLNDRTRWSDITTYGAYTAMLAACNDGLKYDQAPWLTKYPEVNKIMTDITADGGKHIPKNENLIGNLFFANATATKIDSRNASNGRNEGNVTAADGSVFVNASGSDWRVTAEAKAAQNIGAKVLDEGFDMSAIGPKRTLSLTYEPVRLQYPLTGDSPSADSLTLVWEDVSPADEYFYEIATDAAFTNVVKSGTAYENVAGLSGLDKNSVYYWRVTAKNLSKDYKKSWTSDTGVFRTASEIVTVQSFRLNAQNKPELVYSVDGSRSAGAAVIVAVKSANELIGAAVFSDPVTSNQINTFTKQLSVAIEPEYTVECFAFSSTESLIPIDGKKRLFLER